MNKHCLNKTCRCKQNVFEESTFFPNNIPFLGNAISFCLTKAFKKSEFKDTSFHSQICLFIDAKGIQPCQLSLYTKSLFTAKVDTSTRLLCNLDTVKDNVNHLSNVVYQDTCTACSSSYIGQTARIFSTRNAEHEDSLDFMLDLPPQTHVIA